MSVRTNTDVAASPTLRNLTEAYRSVGDSLERLASGQKVNRAADNPASLVVSETFRAQIASLDQALANTEVAASVVHTAEGALGEISGILINLRQLAVAAGNTSVYDENALAALQRELQLGLEAIDRVAMYTSFGRIRLLDGSQSASGITTGDALEFVGATMRTQPSPVRGYEVNVSRAAKRAEATAEIDDSDAAELTLVLEELGGSSVRITGREDEKAQSYVARLQEAVREAGMRLDVNYNQDSEELTIRHQEFGSAQGFRIGSSEEGIFVEEDDSVQTYRGSDIRGSIGGEGAVGRGAELRGAMDNANTSGLRVRYTGSDLGMVGRVSVAQNSLTFQIGTEKDQRLKIAIDKMDTQRLARSFPNRSGYSSLADVQVLTQQQASDTIAMLDKAISQVNMMRGNLGAIQKGTLETQATNLRNMTENLRAADSSIRDADLAEQLTEVTKQQIMVDAAAAAVAQGNELKADSMSRLLRG
jgi:flagellin